MASYYRLHTDKGMVSYPFFLSFFSGPIPTQPAFDEEEQGIVHDPNVRIILERTLHTHTEFKLGGNHV